jgi:hypothetical protein
VDNKHLVVARLWGPFQPIDRGEIFEAPLSAALKSRRLGSVTGGGSQLADTGEVLFADIEISLADLDTALQLTQDTLEQAGAPAGSEFLYSRGVVEETRPFGTTQCLAIYLDGIDLPEEVYATADVTDLAGRVDASLAPDFGGVKGTWSGRQETALYVYGSDAEAMLRRLESLLRTYPLCQNARVVLRHGNPNQQARTVRITRHPPA